MTVIVAVDATLGLIRLKAESSLLDGAPNDFRSPDYVALAGSFRINAVKVESAEALANSVTESLAGRRSTLIECPIEFRLLPQDDLTGRYRPGDSRWTRRRWHRCVVVSSRCCDQRRSD